MLKEYPSRLGTEPDARGGKGCSQLRDLTGSLMYITNRVHVCNHQSYTRSLWTRQLLDQIWGVADGQTKALVRAQQTNSKMNIRNNLGVINMCMHGVFLHANRVVTVHTACSGPFDFGDQEAGQTGITLTDDREWKHMCYICMAASNSWLPCSTSSWPASLIPRLKFKFEWSLKWKGGHYIQCTSAHLMHDWTQHRRVVWF